VSLEQQVNQFNETYKKDMSPIPRLPTEPEATLLVNLITEELMELNEALDNGDLVEVSDAIADLLYVTAQQARLIGLPVDALVREVHGSNMSKLGADGKPVYREDGKVLKGPNFSEPDIARVLRSYNG
jgi:predicted HAD superfamily Cof-like phosphohydrolase